MSERSIVDEPLEGAVDEADNGVKRYKCEGCGESFDTSIAKATHVRGCDLHAAWKAEQREAKEDEREAVEPEEESPYRGEGEPNEILRQILNSFPGVTKAVVIEVMSWAELWGHIPPYYLPYLLGQMKGVSQGTANLITQKYSLAMQKNEQMQRAMGPQLPMGVGMMGGGPPGTVGMYPPAPMGFQPPSMVPFQPYGQQPYGAGYGYNQPGQYGRPPPGAVTRADLDEAIRKMGEKSEMQRLQETVGDLTKTVGNMKNDIIREVGDSRTQYREIRVPIDADGNPTAPSKAVSVRYERVPIAIQGGGGSQSSEVLSRLDAMDKKITDQTLGKIQKDLEELKRQPPGEGRSRELDKLEEKLERQEEMIGSLSGQIEENKYNALLDELGRIKTQLGRAGAGEWDSDEMKFVSNALNRVADVIEAKKPIEVLKEALFPQGQFPPIPDGMQTPIEGTPQTLVEQLRERGLVSTLTRGRR